MTYVTTFNITLKFDMLAGILVMTMSKLYYKGKKVLLCKKTTLHKDPCSEHHSDDVFDRSCSEYLRARIFLFLI